MSNEKQNSRGFRNPKEARLRNPSRGDASGRYGMRSGCWNDPHLKYSRRIDFFKWWGWGQLSDLSRSQLVSGLDSTFIVCDIPVIDRSTERSHMDEKNPANSSKECKQAAMNEDRAWCTMLNKVLREIETSPTPFGSCRSHAIPYIEGAIQCLEIDADCLANGTYPVDLPPDPRLIIA
jgi:hypothetical protein